VVYGHLDMSRVRVCFLCQVLATTSTARGCAPVTSAVTIGAGAPVRALALELGWRSKSFGAIGLVSHRLCDVKVFKSAVDIHLLFSAIV
jgi:hypothetical protein